jgi:NADPH-dependent 2,4-dienoyl-CoA reductase/sulfur reductase-like enzyme/CxxC motif-containing protein
MSTDVLVIGSGPAGMQAAISARDAGAKVTILERDWQLGGILNQCIHHGFGVHFFRENLAGTQFAEKLRESLEGIEIRLNTMVLEVKDDSVVVASDRGVEEIECKALVLAMGCRERSRDSLGIPGSRPAGVYTAGQAQRLINIEGYLPGKDIVILGSGDVGLIMARRLALEGCSVKCVVEIKPFPGGLMRNVVQCLEDFNIPLLLNHTVTRIIGKDRVEGVEISEVDTSLRPSGKREVVPCDTLLLSVGLIPENDVVGELVDIDPVTGGPRINQFFQTSNERIFACGNALHVNDLVDNVAREASIAGESAASYSLGKLEKSGKRRRVLGGNGIVSVVPQWVDGSSQVRFYMRAVEPMKSVNLRVKGTDIKFFKRFIRPAESLVVNLAGKRIDEMGDEIVFEVEKEEESEAEERALKTYVCTLCPVGCEISLLDGGEIRGYQCKRGLEFVEQEEKEPMRILTTTVYVKGGELRMLPVRSAGDIMKEDMQEAMREAANVLAEAPIKEGQDIFVFKGVPFIATRSIARKGP